MMGANEMLLRALHRNAFLDVGIRRLRGGVPGLASSTLVSDTLGRYASFHTPTSRRCSQSFSSQRHCHSLRNRSSSSSSSGNSGSRSTSSSTATSSSRISHGLAARALTPNIGTVVVGAKSMAPSPLPLRDPLTDITAQSSVATKAASASVAALAPADDSRRGTGSLGVGGEKRRFHSAAAAAAAVTGGVLSAATLLKGKALGPPSVDICGSPLCASPRLKKSTVSGSQSGTSVKTETEEEASWDTSEGAGGWRAGGIHIILGPMFAGKTTALLHQVSAAKAEGREVLLVKSGVDTRYAVNEVVSHNGERMRCLAIASLADIPQLLGQEAYDKVDVIGVDEAQFIKDVEFFAAKAADEHGKTIILAGLDSDFMRYANPLGPGALPVRKLHEVYSPLARCWYSDFMRRRFGGLVDLVPMADSVVKLKARCQVCGDGAIFTLRKTRDMRTELVGGSDLYMPVCRKHYLAAKSLVGSLPDVPQDEDSSVPAK